MTKKPKIEVRRERGVSKAAAKTVAKRLFAEGARMIAQVAKPRAAKAGYLGLDGEYAIEPRWDRAFEHADGIAEVRIGLQSFAIDAKGKQHREPYAGVGVFSRGLLPVGLETNVAWGYVDGKGAVKIRGPFEEAHAFYGPLAAVLVGGRHRWITPEGELVGDPFAFQEYLPQCRFREDRVFTGEYGKGFHLWNEQGKRIGKTTYADATPFSDGVAAVMEAGATTWRYIDRAGKPAIAGKLARAFAFVDGRALVFEGGKARLIDRAGAPVGKPFASDEHRSSTQISEGLVAFVDGKKRVGYLRALDGEVAIAPKLANGGPFVGGFARVCPPKQVAKQSFIDRTGALLTDKLFDTTYDFSEGRAAVKVGRKWGFLDERGKLIVKLRYGQVFSYRGGLAAVTRL